MFSLHRAFLFLPHKPLTQAPAPSRSAGCRTQGPFPPPVSCASLGYRLNLSVPQLPHLQKDDNDGIVEYYKDEIC